MTTSVATSRHLLDYRKTWECKPALRVVYNDFCDRITAACVPGPTIEIGGGIGNLKQRFLDVVATDFQFSPWIDVVADAQRLPFATDRIANLVMVDVLHHLEFPIVFLREAQRVLRGGGRVVMVEPAITWGSSIFYRILHHEPVRMSADVLRDGQPNPQRDPYAANQAIPTILATRDRERFHDVFPNLRIAQVQWFSFACYALTGGFKSWCLLSELFAQRLLKIERPFESTLGRLAGFRMMLVIEKLATENS
jgi:SAM-dependent methyltransferase